MTKDSKHKTPPSASIDETVTPPFSTVHLPPERAVLTTPAIVGLMERCVRLAEDEDGWASRSAEVRHRAGLRTGEMVDLEVQAGEEGRDGWAGGLGRQVRGGGGCYVFPLPFIQFILDWLFAGLVIVLLVNHNNGSTTITNFGRMLLASAARIASHIVPPACLYVGWMTSPAGLLTTSM